MALRLSTGFRNKQLGITTELVTNGDFETAIGSEWTADGGTIAVSSGTGVGATDSGRVTGGGAGNNGVYQDVTVKGGRDYLVKVSSQRTGAGNTAEIYVGISGDTDKYGLIEALDEAAYVTHYFFFTPLVSETTIRISLSITGAGVTTYDFDDVSLIDLSHSIQDIFDEGFIQVYTGTQPTLANDAPTGTLLFTIYSDGSSAGITFDDAVSGVLSKAAAESWTGTAVASGTAGWFRLIGNDDGGASSTLDERLDGAVATSGAELNLSSTSIAASAVQAISTFSITYPAS